MNHVSGHGGYCCGISHFHTFGHWGVGSHRRAAIKEALEKLIKDHTEVGASRVIEVTLTDEQIIHYEGLKDYLKGLGFKVVNRFRNSNSGNMVNVLHLCTGDSGNFKNSSPFNK